MQNTITIHTTPLEFTSKQLRTFEGRLRYKLANDILQGAKNSLFLDLTHSIPVFFRQPIELTISVKKSDFTIKVDYSRIKIKHHIRLIKYYIKNQKEAFATEWMSVFKDPRYNNDKI